jgi:hypothetical protein
VQTDLAFYMARLTLLPRLRPEPPDTLRVRLAVDETGLVAELLRLLESFVLTFSLTSLVLLRGRAPLESLHTFRALPTLSEAAPLIEELLSSSEALFFRILDAFFLDRRWEI